MQIHQRHELPLNANGASILLTRFADDKARMTVAISRQSPYDGNSGSRSTPDIQPHLLCGMLYVNMRFKLLSLPRCN